MQMFICVTFFVRSYSDFLYSPSFNLSTKNILTCDVIFNCINLMMK